MQELKIRISNHQEIENKLKDLGAVFSAEERFTDTYFKQPEGKVLKLSTTDLETNLVKLESIDGKFKIVSKQHIEDIAASKKELSDEYGIKAVLSGKRRYFDLNDLKITVNFINDLGEFLILTGENPTQDFITQKLGIKNPQYIRVSFDELKK